MTEYLNEFLAELSGDDEAAHGRDEGRQRMEGRITCLIDAISRHTPLDDVVPQLTRLGVVYQGRDSQAYDDLAATLRKDTSVIEISSGDRYTLDEAAFLSGELSDDTEQLFPCLYAHAYTTEADSETISMPIRDSKNGIALAGWQVVPNW